MAKVHRFFTFEYLSEPVLFFTFTEVKRQISTSTFTKELSIYTKT